MNIKLEIYADIEPSEEKLEELLDALADVLTKLGYGSDEAGDDTVESVLFVKPLEVDVVDPEEWLRSVAEDAVAVVIPMKNGENKRGDKK